MNDGWKTPPREYVNINGLMGTLISTRMATLHELQTVYCLEDAFDMYEAYIVPKYNEWREIESQKHQGRRK